MSCGVAIPLSQSSIFSPHAPPKRGTQMPSRSILKYAWHAVHLWRRGYGFGWKAKECRGAAGGSETLGIGENWLQRAGDCRGSQQIWVDLLMAMPRPAIVHQGMAIRALPNPLRSHGHSIQAMFSESSFRGQECEMTYFCRSHWEPRGWVEPCKACSRP